MTHTTPAHRTPKEATTTRADQTATDETETVAELHQRINRLEIILAATRQVHADLVAAALVTMAAVRDGHPDPLVLLRDELFPPDPPDEAVPDAGRTGSVW